MKKFLLAFFIVVGSLGLKAQYITIPDANFATWLHNNGWDSCMVGNQLDTICARSVTIQAHPLNLSNQNISNLSGIEYVQWCSNGFPCSGAKSINLSHNIFTKFPAPLLPLIYNLTINLSYNNIDTFILHPEHAEMQSLDLSHNGMTAFIKDAANANYDFGALYLNDNNLTSYPYVYSNGGTGYFMNIRNNQLTSFPNGNFTNIDCGRNQLSSFAGWGFKYLASTIRIDSNQFTGNLDLAGIGTYWDVLYKLDCSHNAITSISNLLFPSMSLNNHTGTFLCNDNNLTVLPYLPSDTRVIDCHNNPNLHCITNLPNVSALLFDYSNTAIECLPRQFPNCVYTSTPSINAVPACDMYNNKHDCPQYSNLEGYVYVDVTGNCAPDSADAKLDFVKVRLLQSGVTKQEIYTDLNGHYSFDITDYNSYTLQIDTPILPVDMACPDSGYYSATVDSQHLYQNGFDFGFGCKPGFDLVAQSIWGRFVPGNTREVIVCAGEAGNFYGVQCALAASGSVQLILNGSAHYTSPASGALTPTTIAGDTLTWSIADFGTVNFCTDFNIMVQTDTTAQLGSQICFKLIVTTTTAGEYNLANNTLTLCFTVVGSFDPNEKEVYPAGNIDTAQEWLTYTIHFQNTGTAEAQHIYVDDTLDTDLDVASFQLLAYSHPPILQLKQNEVRFNFPNINLPDSNTNEPLSHGYVQYKIKLKENLPVGTTINNTAFIYFDFNAPVVTNTTTNTIVTTTGVSEIKNQKSEIRIYPNPANTTLNIQTENFNPVLVSVFDINGRKISEQRYSQQIDVSTLTSGIYFIELKGSDAVARKRFVKM